MSNITKEEAIEQFKYAIDLIKQDGKDYLDERDIPILEMGIEALENQKSRVEELEKIKAEIDEPMRDTTDSYGRGYACAMFKCLEIIDNHIKELKGENNE